jgi:hypothetical protein
VYCCSREFRFVISHMYILIFNQINPYYYLLFLTALLPFAIYKLIILNHQEKLFILKCREKGGGK